MSYKLTDAAQQHKKHPATFEIPSQSRRRGLGRGDTAKLIFLSDKPCPDGRFEGTGGERMWVTVETVVRKPTLRYIGKLDNEPHFVDAELGERVDFGPEHVIDIYD